MRMNRWMALMLVLASVAFTMSLLARGSHQADAGSSTTAVATPSPTPTVYPTPTLAQVQTLCNNADLTVYKWNFVSPYVLCYIADNYTNSVFLYQAQGALPGTFVRIRSAGGAFTASHLVSLGVPSTTAATLTSGLHYP